MGFKALRRIHLILVASFKQQLQFVFEKELANVFGRWWYHKTINHAKETWQIHVVTQVFIVTKIILSN